MDDSTTPRPFQYFATFRALTSMVFMLGLPTGCGKTFIAYMIYAYYRNKMPKTKLIVGTKNSAIIQFGKEWSKFFNDATTVEIMHKDMPKRSGESYAQARARVLEMFARESNPKDPINRNIDVLIMGHTGLRLERKQIVEKLQRLRREGWNVIFVLDEATVVKKYNTETHQSVHEIAKYADRKVPMTATMTKGKLEEIYMIFRCFGMMLAKNKQEFLNYFCLTVGDGESAKVIGYKNTREFVEQLRRISLVLRKRDIAAWLPTFTASFSRIDQDEHQIRFIHKCQQGEIKLKDKETGLNIDMLPITEVAFTKMALCDPTTQPDHIKLPDGYIAPKMEELLTLLDEEYCGERVIVYTPYLRQIEAIQRVLYLKGNQIDPRYARALRITGAESPVQREENRVLFTEGSKHRILLVNDAGLEALNLQAANNLVLMTMPKTGGDLIQLAGRISRMDTTHSSLNIRYMLHNHSQDEDDYAIVMQQAAIIGRVQGGDPEPGLIDVEVLAEAAKISADRAKEMLSETADKVLLHERRKHKAWYNAAVKGLK